MAGGGCLCRHLRGVDLHRARFLALRFCVTRGSVVTGRSQQGVHFCEGSGEERPGARKEEGQG